MLKEEKRQQNLKYDQKKARKVLQLPVNSIKVPELQLPIKLDGKITVDFEIDTGGGESFIGKNTWHKIGKPTFEEPTQHFESASQHQLPILKSITLQTETSAHSHISDNQKRLKFNVSELPMLNLLGRNAIKQLGISVDTLMKDLRCHAVFEELKPDREL